MMIRGSLKSDLRWLLLQISTWDIGADAASVCVYVFMVV